MTEAKGVIDADQTNLKDFFTSSVKGSFKDANTYSVTYKLNDNVTNYKLGTDVGNKSIKINPAIVKPEDITLTWKASRGVDPAVSDGVATVEYEEGKTYSIAATFKAVGDDVNTDAAKITVADLNENQQYTEPKADGYAPVVTAASFNKNHPNYELGEDVTAPKLVISKQTITVTWPKETAYEYTGEEVKPEPASVVRKSDGSDPTAYFKYKVEYDADPAGDSKVSPVSVGSYTAKVVCTDKKDEARYDIVTPEQKYSITKKTVSAADLTWKNTDPVYNGKEQWPTATFTGVGADKGKAFTITKYVEKDGKKTIDAGNYKVAPNEEFDNYQIADDAETDFTIERKEVKADDLTWDKISQTYAGTVLWPTATFKDGDDTYSVDTFVEKDEKETRNVATYNVSPAPGTTFTKVGSDPAEHNKNYVIDEVSKDFTITQAEAKVNWTGSQTYYYDSNAHRPTAAFEGLGDDKGSHKLDVSVDGSKDLESPVHVKTGEDGKAADYSATASFKEEDKLFAQNYKLTGTEQSYTILPRGVTITPKGGQERYYGQADPGTYKKTITFADPEGGQNQLDEAKLTGEIQAMQAGTDVIKYVDDDPNAAVPGDYPFVLNLKDDAENRADFDVTVTPDVIYTINKFDISISTDEINSRTGSFKVDMDSLNDLKKGQTADPNLYSRIKPVVSLAFADDTKGIRYDQNLVAAYYGTDSFYSNQSDQLGSKILTPDVAYSVKGYKDSWLGKLPAGTKVTVKYVDIASGTVVSEKTSFTVTKKKVSLSIEPSGVVTGTDAASGVNYLKKGATITVTGSNGEVARVTYNDSVVREGDSIFDYLVKITARDNGNSHSTQNVEAGFLDVLNLDFTEQKYAFVYDDKAFDVTTIEFSNRDKKIHIVLPETGTLNSVTIAGAKVSLDKAARGKEFDLDVKWSGKSLIRTGTAITVEYTDQAGNVGKGSSSAKRSTVSTPITLKIRPDLNPKGFLNGMGDGFLIVSGTACGDEPIRVTVAGSSQETYATGKEVWSDSTGTWEVRFNMSQLPEGGDFTISAEYVDVNGRTAAMTAKYNAYVCKPAGLSPLFDMMPFMSGMVEPGTSVTLVIGDQNYAMNVDGFGHFLLNDLDLLAPGDKFIVKVYDIAGNVNLMEFTVPEGDDMGRITAPLQPLGKFFYDGGKDASSVYDATPLQMTDLQKGDQEIPLLYGLTYKVGKMTLQKTDEGFTISNELDPDIFTDPDTYEESDQTLYVYDHQPTLEELRNHAGTEYKPGDEIKAADDAVVWIQYEENLKMMPDDLTSDIIYNFEYLDEEQREKEPEKFEEYKAYDAYQRFDGKVSEEASA